MTQSNYDYRERVVEKGSKLEFCSGEGRISGVASVALRDRY